MLRNGPPDFIARDIIIDQDEHCVRGTVMEVGGDKGFWP